MRPNASPALFFSLSHRVRSSTRSAILRGRGLFDRGAFFEAHEVWEAAWLTESGPVRVLLQGLIQIAAALYKASRAEHPGGCVRLFDAGLAKLASAGDAVPGFPPARFVRDVRSVRERAQAWSDGKTGAPSREDHPKIGGSILTAREATKRKKAVRREKPRG